MPRMEQAGVTFAVLEPVPPAVSVAVFGTTWPQDAADAPAMFTVTVAVPPLAGTVRLLHDTVAPAVHEPVEEVVATALVEARVRLLSMGSLSATPVAWTLPVLVSVI